MNLKNGIEIYLAWKDSHTNVAASRYKVRLSHFEKFLGKTTLLSQITGEDIIHYHREMQKSYSNSTVAYSARILKNFFDFWRGRGIAQLNPKEIIPIRFITADKAVVTQDDFEEMNESLNPRYFDELVKKIAINLLWDTGMRVSELTELTISDIETDPKTGQRYAKVRSRKSMRYNLVTWGREVDSLLNIYLGIRLCIDAPGDALIVNSSRKSGDKVSTRTIQRWIKEILDLTPIDKEITPHSFRHGKAHRVLSMTENIRDVQAILRHVSPESTLHYLQLNPTRYLEVAQKYV